MDDLRDVFCYIYLRYKEYGQAFNTPPNPLSSLPHASIITSTYTALFSFFPLIINTIVWSFMGIAQVLPVMRNRGAGGGDDVMQFILDSGFETFTSYSSSRDRSLLHLRLNFF